MPPTAFRHAKNRAWLPPSSPAFTRSSRGAPNNTNSRIDHGQPFIDSVRLAPWIRRRGVSHRDCAGAAARAPGCRAAATSLEEAPTLLGSKF
jgi:hypothetical protein